MTLTLFGEKKKKRRDSGCQPGMHLITIFSLPKIVFKKQKKFREYFLKLLFVEPNNLVIYCGQICRNPLATWVCGQILYKDNI